MVVHENEMDFPGDLGLATLHCQPHHLASVERACPRPLSATAKRYWKGDGSPEHHKAVRTSRAAEHVGSGAKPPGLAYRIRTEASD